nr:hypothetical protein [Tanacetum cinerariifolium]
MTQPSLVVSTQLTYRIHSTHRSPKPKSMLQKLKGKLVEEISELRNLLRVKVKHLQPAPISFMVTILTSAEIKQHQVNKTQDLILAKVDDVIPTGQVKQMVEGGDVEDDTLSDLTGIMKKSDDALYAVVPRITIVATNDHLKDDLLMIISRELATCVPNIIEDIFKEHMESIASNVRSSSNESIAFIFDLQHCLYLKMKKNTQSQIDDFVIWRGLNLTPPNLKIDSGPTSGC